MTPSKPYMSLTGQTASHISISHAHEFFSPLNKLITDKQLFEASKNTRQCLSALVLDQCIINTSVEGAISEYCGNIYNQVASSEKPPRQKQKKFNTPEPTLVLLKLFILQLFSTVLLTILLTVLLLMRRNAVFVIALNQRK